MDEKWFSKFRYQRCLSRPIWNGIARI
jgi:hypothetical protein